MGPGRTFRPGPSPSRAVGHAGSAVLDYLQQVDLDTVETISTPC